MDGQNLVSIIVPVYNAGSYISQTIEMVQAQDYSQWELILVDDCSTDDSVFQIEQKINEDDKRIQLLKKGCNEGAAAARNTGIDAATGRYIAFLDADDVWKPDKLSHQLKFIKEKQAAFTFTSYEFGNENAEGTGKIVHAPGMLTYRRALSRTVIFTSTVMLDITQTGRELIHMPLVESEDSATWWKILRNGFTAYGLDEILTIYRRPARSLSSNKLKAIKRIWRLYRREEKLPILQSIIYLLMWAVRATLRRI